MKLIHALLVAAIGILNMFATCDPRLYSPPARLWSVETPGSLPKGRNAITAIGGTHIGYYGFNFSAFSGTLQYRKGFTENLEGCGSFSFMYINPQEYSLDISTVTGNIRLGTKYNFSFAKRVMAARGGIGLGTSGIGQYFSLDIGLVLGFENPYLVPFITGGYQLSQPFNTKIVDFGADDDGKGSADEAEFTNGWEFGGGFRVGPFAFTKSAYDLSLAFYGLGAWTQLRSPNHRESDSPISIGGGVEFYFGGKEGE